MTRSEIERAVVRATGENRRTVRRYGFSLVIEEPEPPNDPRLVLDCPGCGAHLDAAGASNDIRKLIDCPRCDALYPFAVDELYVADGSNAALAACA
jgi:hypothetical protein